MTKPSTIVSTQRGYLQRIHTFIQTEKCFLVFLKLYSIHSSFSTFSDFYISGVFRNMLLYITRTSYICVHVFEISYLSDEFTHICFQIYYKISKVRIYWDFYFWTALLPFHSAKFLIGPSASLWNQNFAYYRWLTGIHGS